MIIWRTGANYPWVTGNWIMNRIPKNTEKKPTYYHMKHPKSNQNAPPSPSCSAYQNPKQIQEIHRAQPIQLVKASHMNLVHTFDVASH